MAGIANFKAYGFRGQARPIYVLTRRIDGGRVDIHSEQGGVELRRDATSGVIFQVAPETSIMVPEPFKSKWAPDSRGHPKSDPGGLYKNSPAAAEWVKQRLTRVPIRQGQKTCSEILADRSFTLVEPPSALEERLSAGIQVKRRCVFGKEEMNPRIRSDSVDVGPASFFQAKSVADSILGSQIAVLQAFHGAANCRRIYPEGLLCAKPAFPFCISGKFENIVLVLNGCLRHLNQYPGGQA